jgi:hypothetical protein
MDARNVHKAATELTEMSSELKSLVSQFKYRDDNSKGDGSATELVAPAPDLHPAHS